MRDWSLEIKVGLVIMIAVVFMVVLLLNAADWHWGSGGREVQASFQSVADIQEGAPVYLSGVNVGKIVGIHLTESGVLVKANISDEEQPLRTGCTASITMLGLVGESVLFLENGPLENPTLPEDAVIEGKDPVNVMEMLQDVNQTVKLANETILSVQGILEDQDRRVTSLIGEVHRLVEDTERNIESISSDTRQIASDLSSAIKDSNAGITGLLRDVRTWGEQLHSDTARLMAQMGETNEQISSLIRNNEPQAQKALADLSAAADNLHRLSIQMETQSQDLMQRTTSLVSDVGSWLDQEQPQVHELIGDLRESAQQLEPLLHSMHRISQRLEQGDGTIPRLLNEPDTLVTLERTAKEAQKTLATVRQLSEALTGSASGLPRVGWEYELRYRTEAEQLQNEANLVLRDEPDWRYSIGVTGRDDDLGLNLQAAYRLAGLTLRGGLIRSETALALDYALLDRRLRFTLEGIGITREAPVFLLEGGVQPIYGWELVFGVESPPRRSWELEDLEVHLGLRLDY